MSMSIGFVGAGQMARALAQGVCQANLVMADHIWASDVSREACDGFRAAVPGSQVVARNTDLLEHCDVIFLSVKPQHLQHAAEELATHLPAKDRLFVSIAAGIPLGALTSWLRSQRVIRVMPNTPALVGAGASAYATASGVTEEDERHVVSLLQAVGSVAPVSEKLLDAVTGLSGSGPAYVFLMIESLTDAGVLQGLARPIALQLAAQTVLGSAQMVLTTGLHPAELRDRVTSPGGTTAHGLQALEEHGLRAGILAAVQAATRRARELGDG